MGRPTITKFGANQYVEGTTLVVNDANMLGEIAGNIESRVNVQSFNNYFTMSFFWEKDHETYTFGNKAMMAAIQLPVRFRVEEVQLIGFASDSTNSQFENGSVGAASDNNVKVYLEVVNSTGEAGFFSDSSGNLVAELTETVDTPGKWEKIGDISGIKGSWAGGSASPDPLGIEVGTSQTLTLSCEIPGAANSNFVPMIQAVVIGTMEHAE